MFLPRKMFALALVCLGSVAAAQPPTELAAARALGPQWKQLARSAGMVFAGTVLQVEALPASDEQAIPTMKIKIRVDRAIAGVRQGQVLMIREWAGAWSMHRPMRTGQRILLFLYPPSRLGLTSPVGGPLGQVALDPSGKNVAARVPALANGHRNARPLRQSMRAASGQNISMHQLERAIRNAREE
jgi:hypothetical protein